MKKTKTLISIVTVAGLNRKKGLINLIKSVNKSTYKNFEILVIDNSQNPHLKKIITKKFSKVCYLNMPTNTGVLGFNIGFANAKGEYILALDDDCTINPDTLENIIKIFPTKAKNVAVLSTNIYKPLVKKYCFEHLLKNNIQNINIAANMAVYKKIVFAKVGYFDPDFFLWVHEDDLSIRILNHNLKIHFEPKIIVNHYEKMNFGLRKDMAFLLSRNLAWFNLKHFSYLFLPLLILRNLITIFLMPIKRKSAAILIFALAGYISGLLTFFIPLKKRKVVNFKLQIKFLKFYLLNRI